ncbi:uncharacterized protein METZ01_LOCUS243813 [marine metagenome]|uniref:Uncharacterized protein n=1 Tax=marine metagenome TaxID=408172 RepID=A0A382HUV9_9ZZZZ
MDVARWIPLAVCLGIGFYAMGPGGLLAGLFLYLFGGMVYMGIVKSFGNPSGGGGDWGRADGDDY